MILFDYLLKPIRNEAVIQSMRQATEEMRRRKAALENVERVDTFTRQAQLMSLLTNPSQKGQGVRTMLEDLHLRFGAYYIHGQWEISQLQAALIRDHALLHLKDAKPPVVR